MSGTDSVLVVLDGSAQDVATVDWATDEAAALGTGLTVAHLHAGPVTPDRAPLGCRRSAVDRRRACLMSRPGEWPGGRPGCR